MAAAQVPVLTPLNIKARYDVTAGPAKIGRLRITALESTFNYDLKIDTKTSGLMKMFSSESSIAATHGARSEDGKYIPITYTSDSDKDGDDHDRHVRVAYDEDGAITERSRKPGDTPSWRPVVSLEQASEAVDPITGFFILRQKLRDAMAHNQREVSVMTYDGARLATLTIKVVSRARIEINDEYVSAINTIITRQPVTGYTKKELAKFKKGDPTIHIYFSADARFIPLQASIHLAYGDITATLAQSSKAQK